MSDPGKKTVTCGLCHFEFEHGARVCRGCQGTVVYGATAYELGEARKMGASLWGGGTLLLLYALPLFLNSQFGWKVKMGWGLDFWGLAIAAVAAVWGAFHHGGAAYADKYDLIRTFR